MKRSCAGHHNFGEAFTFPINFQGGDNVPTIAMRRTLLGM